MRTDLQSEYRSIFARLGFPLSVRHGIPGGEIDEAENRAGIRLPKALRDYYLVAGKEKILNHSFNRLCSPSEWEIHSGKLIFMEENQTVLVWGISISKTPAQNPMVFQCPLVQGELGKWYSEQTRCSEFLTFMAHLQAAYGGGMPFTASAPTTEDPAVSFNSNWSIGGEVNGMRAYSMRDRVVCVTKWQEFGSDKKTWRVFGGAKRKDDLTAMGTEFKISWDS